MTGIDDVEARVLDAILAVQSGNRALMVNAYEGLAQIPAGDVIAELFVWIDDLCDGVDRDVLLATATLPLPVNPVAILDAVADRDWMTLQSASGSDGPEKALAALMVLVASLKDARTRL